uniref:Epoxide hydrolase N-terminal domain-containing protein n=1 Tax=Anopheles dirus TaxID=7168 RepID=A0A182NAI9_9DIPT
MIEVSIARWIASGKDTEELALNSTSMASPENLRTSPPCPRISCTIPPRHAQVVFTPSSKMGFCGKVLFVVVSLISAVVFKQYRELAAPLPVPELDLKRYWGPGDVKQYKEDTAIKPFTVSYGEPVIEKLRAKLDDVPTLTPPLEGTAFEYGFNTDRLKEIIKYWRTTYLGKWGEREKYLNQFPHFHTQIQGLNIHFIHVKPKVPAGTKVLPVLLLHGWPGSVREFYDIIPKLTTKSKDKDFVFEVIVPSLPGYGWSQGSAKKGLSPSEVAIVMKNLMSRVGFEKFYIQGGDWGSLIGNVIATYFQENVLGVHLNMCSIMTPLSWPKSILASFRPSLFIDERYTEFYYPLGSKFASMIEESGYMHIQATKPDTIGTALQGNPVGLAAYILEKFSTWTNPAYRNLHDGGLEKFYKLDSLLDNVMIYYLTDSITTSQRIYAEAFGSEELKKEVDRIPTVVPAACAKFRHELFQQIDWVLKDHFVNLVQGNHFDDGGHFAAMQLPDVLYKDFVTFIASLQKHDRDIFSEECFRNTTAMGLIARAGLISFGIVIALGYRFYQQLSVTPRVPSNIDFYEYWGPEGGDPYGDSLEQVPFNISYPSEVIERLRKQLYDAPTLPAPLEGTAFQYGFNSERLQEIVQYWRSDYLDRWDEREAFLNQFKHYKTTIQGLEIHFIRETSDAVRNPKRIVPLLLLHGWPGSVREFYDIIPMLSNRSSDKEYVFDVIVPSLPGYGWSQATSKPGLSVSKVAVIMKNLMSRLGYRRFYIQGGDWGAVIGNVMAVLFEKDILGVHLNMCMASRSPLMMAKTLISDLVPSYFIEEKFIDFYHPSWTRISELILEGGYMHLQATKPDTIGTALETNPIGLAAYILEKFSTWTNPTNRDRKDGGLEQYFSLDALLDNVMVYYLTNSITTSQRLYAESFSAAELAKQYANIPTSAPAACAKFRHELLQYPDWILKEHFTNLLQSNHYDDGGHFAAMQLPQVLYKDIIQFVNQLYER